MATIASLPSPETASPAMTLADLLCDLGDIPPERVRARPAPGTATEQDVLDINAHEDRLFELVDGVLVEKPTGFRESFIAALLIRILGQFVDEKKLGVVSGPDGFMRLRAGLVRGPDVAFVSWARLPDQRIPAAPIPGLVPDLAIEVLSESATIREMERKRREYFGQGVRMVWMVDPPTRSVTVFTSVSDSRLLNETDTLDGGDVLPGFSVPIPKIFAVLDQHAE